MTGGEREIRAIGDLQVERRQRARLPKLTGYAALFDVEANIAGMFRERIVRGAFAETIRQDDVRALIDHDPSLVIGRNTAGTLALSEDDRGLRVEITPPDTSVARDLVANIEAGNVTQMSFAFVAQREEWSDTAEPPLRTIIEARLLDVSVVTYPAYAETTIAASARAHAADATKRVQASYRRAHKRLERLQRGLRA